MFNDGIMWKLAFLIAAIWYTGTVNAKCQDLPVKQDFDIKLFSGRWYQQWSLGSFYFQGLAKCVYSDFSYNENSGNVNVINTRRDLLIHLQSKFAGTVVFDDPAKTEAKMKVTITLPFIGNRTDPLWVLDTDYTRWAVLYSCQYKLKAIKKIRIRSVFILTRVQSLSKIPAEEMKSINEGINACLTKSGLSRNVFKRTLQKTCWDKN